METHNSEQYFVQWRDKLRQNIQDRGHLNVGDLATLVNLDREISKEKSARKHPRWTKFKNWCFKRTNLANKSRLGKMGAIAKSTLRSMVLSPITAPITVYDDLKDFFARKTSLMRNTFRYDPAVAKIKNPFLRAMKTGAKSLLHMEATNSRRFGLLISDQYIASEQKAAVTKPCVSSEFVPDDKSAILARLQERKNDAIAKNESMSKPKAFTQISPEIWAQLQASAILDSKR